LSGTQTIKAGQDVILVVSPPGVNFAWAVTLISDSGGNTWDQPVSIGSGTGAPSIQMFHTRATANASSVTLYSNSVTQSKSYVVCLDQYIGVQSVGASVSVTGAAAITQSVVSGTLNPDDWEVAGFSSTGSAAV